MLYLRIGYKYYIENLCIICLLYEYCVHEHCVWVLCDSHELLAMGNYSGKHTISNFITMHIALYNTAPLFLGCMSVRYIVSLVYDGGSPV